MGYNGAGGYTRQRNFSADASAGINILASAMDQEFNDFASAMTVPVLKDGQNAPTANLPMGGFKHTNVGAPTSATNYMRVNEFVRQIPIFVTDTESADGSKISVSAAFYTTVSATQAPPDGAKLLVRAANTKSASTVLYLNAGGGNSHSANIIDDHGRPVWYGAITSGGVYEFVYNSVRTAWQLMNPSDYVQSVSCNAKIVDGSGSVLGRENGKTVYINRNKRTISYRVQTSVSVSTSASTNNAAYIISSPQFANWVPFVGIHIGAATHIPVKIDASVTFFREILFLTTQTFLVPCIFGQGLVHKIASANSIFTIPDHIVTGVVHTSTD